jgi:cell division protein FtsB
MSSYVQFERVDDLLAFLCACEKRQTSLGKRGRASYEHVWLAHSPGGHAPLYAMPLSEPLVPGPDVPYEETDAVFGGNVRSGTPPGAKEHLNDLLKRLPLRVRSGPPPASLPALILAARIEGGSVQDAGRLVMRGWRDVPRDPNARSIFYLARDVAGRADRFAVEINGVDALFSYERWRSRHSDAGLKLFVPAWPGTCFLFTEWGYEYAKAQAFFQLYDEQREGAGDVRLLALAGAELRISDLGVSDPRYAFRASEWAVVSGVCDERDEDGIWQITNPGHLANSVSDLVRTPPDVPLVQVPIAIGDSRKVVGSRARLDQRIATLERELQELHARRARGKSAASGDFVPVYCFAADGDGGRSSDLERFLNRPLGELANYRYLRLQNEGNDLHIVMGTQPVALGTALAVRCQGTYLQDRRLFDWGIPLFVRADCALSLDLSEQEMATRAWNELLRQAPIPEDTEALLIEAGTETVTDDLTAPRIRPLSGGNALSDCVAYFNARSPAPPTIVTDGRCDLEETAAYHSMVVPEELRQALNDLREESEATILQAEKQWERTRSRAREVRALARMADIALEVTRAAYEKVPPSWKAFVDLVLKTDEEVGELRTASARQLTEDVESYRQRVAVLAARYGDARAEIAKLESECADMLQEVHRREVELEHVLSELEGQHATLGQRTEALIRLHTELAEKRGNLEGLAAAHAGYATRIEQVTREVDQATQTLAQTQEVNRALIEKLEQAQRKAVQVRADAENLIRRPVLTPAEGVATLELEPAAKRSWLRKALFWKKTGR